ncbi:AAA-like domain-containing protein [Sphingomonas desiccabilis]|uniref:Uncharacterized protein n=1 Tax=Sphingomonas desiccabilis TaxID=429134 RepID=A0A4Q2IYB9_9SPHN|nr:AAA-like domain-containing protein [Sphingomonas desiccabilis]MBB3909736.1 hypothetical protein [Sphingomonas desiccabilis]RXZ34428.1 hypothetical protein EO081_01680 [Sphingomonas desiccabilis]
MAHLQGAVPLKDPDYVERKFEVDLQRELMADRWVLLLGPRQHGKTSALIRLKSALADYGVPTALVDLQAKPVHQTYSAFVTWVSDTVREQLGTTGHPMPDGEDVGALIGTALQPGRSPVVILIDEASNIADATWRNVFYGQLRAISSRRAEASPADSAARLRFVFSGSFRPETLIDAANSPFNVCERIDTDDLASAQVHQLVSDVSGNDDVAIAQRIFEEVGGQPFLVQKLALRIQGQEDSSAALEAEIATLRMGESDHVIDLFRKMLSEPGLSAIGARMVRDGAAPVEAADPDFRYMQVLGLARRQGANLVFRNELYAHVAAASPQLGGTAVAPALAPMFPIAIAAFGKVQDPELREIAWSSHKGAIASYRGGANRLALAGFGGSLEAMLIDMLQRQSEAAIDAAITAKEIKLGGREKRSDPSSWNLVNLIKAAPHFGGSKGFDPPQALRNWRNLIHPSLAKSDYRSDEQFEPEVRAAASLHEILLRDLP